MCGKGKGIHLQRIHIDRNMTCRLYGIRMKRNISCAEELSNICDRLDGTDLVVRRHDTDKRRICTQCFLHSGGIDAPFPIDRNFGHGESACFEITARLMHSGMLNRRGHDMRSVSGCPALLCYPANRPVVALRAAARKEQLIGRRPNQSSRLLPRTHNAAPHRLSDAVQT